jgi:hypothetical protein
VLSLGIRVRGGGEVHVYYTPVCQDGTVATSSPPCGDKGLALQAQLTPVMPDTEAFPAMTLPPAVPSCADSDDDGAALVCIVTWSGGGDAACCCVVK